MIESAACAGGNERGEMDVRVPQVGDVAHDRVEALDFETSTVNVGSNQTKRIEGRWMAQRDLVTLADGETIPRDVRQSHVLDPEQRARDHVQRGDDGALLGRHLHPRLRREPLRVHDW